MLISRIAEITPFRGRAEDQGPGREGGMRSTLVFAVVAVLGIAATLWLASMQLGPGALCLGGLGLGNPSGVCEPF